MKTARFRIFAAAFLLVALAMGGYSPRPSAGGGGGASSWIELTGKPLFVVTDAAYGAIPDDAFDDSGAINLAISACKDAGGGVVFFPRGRYICSGPLIAATNSVITFPQTLAYHGQPMRIELIGEQRGRITDVSAAEAGGTILDFTNAPVGSGVEPSAIAGALSRTFATTDFNAVDVFIDRMNIILHDNPTLNGVNMRNAERANSGDALGIFAIAADGTISEPTHGTRGWIQPRFNNNVVCKMGQTQIGGFAIGAELGEHTSVVGTYIGSCGVGLLVPEGNKRVWGSATIEFCATLVKLPLAVNAPPKINLSIDGESAITGDWRSYTLALDDTNSVGTGWIDFAITEAGSTTRVRPLRSGGSNIQVQDSNALQVDYGYTVAPASKWDLRGLTDSAGSFTLTDHNSVTFTSFMAGNGATFNGSTQYLSNATLNIANADYTIMGWVKINSGAAQVVAAQWSGSVNRWQIAHVGGKLIHFAVNSAGALEEADSGDLDMSIPHFVVAQYIAGMKLLRMKVDDGPWANTTMASVMLATGTPASLTLGAALEGGGNTPSGFLNGQLGLFRIYHGVTTQKVNAEYYAGGRGSNL